MRQPGENPAEIDLAIAQRAEPARPLGPGRIGTIDPGAAIGPELGVLDVERLDPLVIDVDEFQIVELLQHEVAGIIENIGARMVVHRIEEAFESHPVVQVLAGVQLITGVDAVLVELIEDRLPAAAQLGKGFLDDPGRALRPRIDHVPHQRAREGGMAGATEAAAGLCRHVQLLDSPLLPRSGVIVELRRGETVELCIEGRMGCDQLALQMGRKLSHFDAIGGADALDLIDIGLAFRRLFKVEQPGVPGRNLHALVAEIAHVFGDRIERIERRFIAGKLREEDGGAFHARFLSNCCPKSNTTPSTLSLSKGRSCS